jgi:hypothetical protein
MCGSLQPGAQTCVRCGLGPIDVYLGVDAVNASRETLVSLWRDAGLDKRAVADCMADGVPEAAHYKGRPDRTSYLSLHVLLDVHRNGVAAVSAVMLDPQRSSDDGRNSWPRRRSSIAACLKRVLRPVRLRLVHPIDRFKVTLDVQTSPGSEDDYLPPWMLKPRE